MAYSANTLAEAGFAVRRVWGMKTMNVESPKWGRGGLDEVVIDDAGARARRRRTIIIAIVAAAIVLVAAFLILAGWF